MRAGGVESHAASIVAQPSARTRGAPCSMAADSRTTTARCRITTVDAPWPPIPAPQPVTHRRRRLRYRLLLAGLLVAVALSGACAAEGVPEVPAGADGVPDPVLVAGRQVYIDRCANCHGNDGGGGQGTKLSDGLMVTRYPQIDDQIAIVADGVRLMPAFAEVLEPEQIAAVVKYIREIL